MSLLDTGRDLRRLNELITILLKYGFGDSVATTWNPQLHHRP